MHVDDDDRRLPSQAFDLLIGHEGGYTDNPKDPGNWTSGKVNQGQLKGTKYGIATAHFYWVGAIPAMVFVGLFMMQFYYGSKARSAPEYLRLRFDEKTRGFNAISFAVMTVFSSGISMYAMAKLIQTLHVLDAPFRQMGLPQSMIFDAAILVSAVVGIARGRRI